MATSSSVRERILDVARPAAAAGNLPSFAALAESSGVSRATVHRYFRTRSDLLAVVGLEPDPGAQERIVTAVLPMLARDGLARLSMDQLADSARVSRATLYRVFPGKTALLRELVRRYSPVEVIAEVVERSTDRPVAEVIPALARAVALHLGGHLGLLRVLVAEVTGQGPEAEAAREYGLDRALRPLVEYLSRQVAEGRLRTVHPLVAVQMLAGPLMLHLLTRPLAEGLFNFDTPIEGVAQEIADGWVRAMTPEVAAG